MWTRPSRLPGWDVAALVAHGSLLVRALEHFVTRPVAVAPTVHATARPADPVQRAGRHGHGDGRPGRRGSTPAGGVDAADRPGGPLHGHRTAGRRGGRGRGADRDRLLRCRPRPLTVAVSIAALEAVVHGLDLCASCDVPPATIPESSMDHTVRLLAGMAPAVAFVEAATGRRERCGLPGPAVTSVADRLERGPGGRPHPWARPASDGPTSGTT